jgi:hypothetical protein
MRARRTKPYVCVDIDYAEHVRFQQTKDVDLAAGTWLRCVAYSRAQELDGVVPAAWLAKTFRRRFTRVEELVRVGLLRARDDGDYEIHAYAPRNQTRAMIEEERASARERMSVRRRAAAAERPRPVTPNTVRTDDEPTGPTFARTADEQPANERRTNVPVPISLSSSVYSYDSSLSAALPTDNVRSAPRAPAARSAMPPSERHASGDFWLEAFCAGISEQTGRPCTAGRVYLGTLERIVSHHAPDRDAPRATAWLTEQAKAFAGLWDGKHPAKGLTPDGLERWLNEGRQAPPVFGRPRIVQPPAEEWRADDWSDLGATVGG